MIAQPIIALVLAILSVHRPGGAAVVVGALLALVLFVPSLYLASHLRMIGFTLAAARAEPVVAAVHNFVQERGEVPSSLDLLVPRYLSALPSRLPDLKVSRLEAGGWMLAADASTGVLKFDSLSTQDYPHGASHQRLGKWVYHHE